MSVQSYRDLQVWQKSRLLVADIYRLSQAFPKHEQYGLCSQIQRAAVSIPSNIAEGSSKRSTKEFVRFLNIAYGSLAETETQLFLAQDLSYASAEDIELLLLQTSQLGRMINGLIRSLESKTTELRTPNSELSYATQN